MFVLPLQSGSNGNCIYVETADTRLLFDVGISGKRAADRLAAAGRDILAVDAIIVSHDHADHVRSLGIFQRKFKLPCHVSRPTLEAASRQRLGSLGQVNAFVSGRPLRFGYTTVETIRTPHDAADGAAFVVDDGRFRFGLLTDLGHPFPGLERIIASLDAVLIESNYDPQLLESGPYPAFLRRRIASARGHLSNEETADLICKYAAPRMQWACLGHLSEQNNTPELAMQTARRLIGDRVPLHLASRYEATMPLEIG